MKNYFSIAVTIILLVSIIIFKRYQHLLFGWIGEKFVSNKFKGLDHKKYIVLNNFLLPSKGNTASTQLDHIIVSNFGIFCIETKSYQGWIFGDANQAQWTQVIYHSKKRFYNPLRQNYAHVKAVEGLIAAKYPKIKIFSFVAFPYADKLKVSGTEMVGYTRDIISKIKRISEPLLSDLERDEIVNILTNANITDRNLRQEHIKSIKKIKKI